ncbi:MAG: hypothetical protein H7259_09640 [Cytophagales bacterium]|nr:hypothetical protein [Cytophaga sp.]
MKINPKQQPEPVEPEDIIQGMAHTTNPKMNPSTTESRKNVNGDPNLIQGNMLNEEDNMDPLADEKTDES